MIYINDEQDEQKAQLEESQGGTPTGDYIISASALEKLYNDEREAINILIEEGNTEVLLEKIRFYSEIIEMMARALVNKIKE